jgi:alkylation response protein AidB-like acyl-CoA dehydrogenase
MEDAMSSGQTETEASTETGADTRTQVETEAGTGRDRQERLAVLDRIIADIVRPNADLVDQNGEFPEKSVRALAEAGFLKLTVPVEDGGLGAAPSEFGEAVFRLAKACASTAMVYVMHVTSLNSILALPASPERTAHLAWICGQGLLITEAISEPGSGSQWWSVASTAERIEGGYRITARKSFSTSAGHAAAYVVSTRSPGATTDREHALFLVRADQGAISTGVWRGLGLAGNASTWINFDSEVDEAALLYSSEDGNGLRTYNEVNQPLYHLGVSSAYLGIATAAYDAAVARIRSRQYAGNPGGFGSRLSEYPIARRHVGTMAIRLAGIRSMVDDLARRIEEGVDLDGMAVLMTACKVAAAQAATAVAHEAMMASGGMAYARGPLTIERHMRDALAASLMGPNDDFCQELIGRMEIDGSSYHDL